MTGALRDSGRASQVGSLGGASQIRPGMEVAGPAAHLRRKAWAMAMPRAPRVLRCLSDDEILADCLTEDGLQLGSSLLHFALRSLVQESTVFVTAGLDGGGKKRKKKTYTKPKSLA